MIIIDDLSAQRCVACEGGLPPLTPQEIEEYQKRLQEPWGVLENKKITKAYSFKDFKEALDFTNKIGALAEEEGHHPDIQLSYGKVIVELWTHAINGLSDNDFIMAAKIEKIPRS